MRWRVWLLMLMWALAVGAKESGFVLRCYVTRADSTTWTPLDSVHVDIAAVGDTAAVKFNMLGNDPKEVRAMVYGKPGKYMLTLDREGFNPVVREFERKYKDQSVVWLGTIQMEPERRKELKEVEVVGTAIKMVMRGDTIVYDAAAFNLADGSMLEALIRQLPNTVMEPNGVIKVNGRAISSLLINGKDFFQGDMEVAMKNLPAYTVKNVQVYDKAPEDDYLTKSSQKLARHEDEENLVMDVVLKKEYSVGYMGALEGGYGSDNRRKGKAFGLGFTDKWRLSAFVNANNIKDTSEAGTGGDWTNGWYMPGDARLVMEGVDYLYDDEKKLRVNGNVIFSHERYDSRSEMASTRFYDTGDLYRRSASRELDKRRHLRSAHTLNYKGEHFFFSITPKIDWLAKTVSNIDREATFNARPEPENSRVEALDSVFARPFSKRYNDIMLTRLRTASVSNPGWLGLYLSSNATIRTPQMGGRLRASVDLTYANDYSDYRTLYTQRYGGANVNPGAPVNSDRYSTSGSHRWQFSGTAGYDQKWTDVDELRSLTYSLSARAEYHMTHIDKDYTLFTAEGDGDESALPSLTMPEHAVADAMNSYNSINSDHNLLTTVSFHFNRQPTAPTDSGLNPAWNAGAQLRHKFRHNSLDYRTAEPSRELVVRNDSYLYPSAWCSFSSSNDVRYLTTSVNYGLSWGEPNINLFLKNRESSNPLVVYENNAGNLRPSRTHTVSWSLNRYGRKVYDRFGVNLNWSTTLDAIGNASVYNPETGVTVYRPQNINGNWSINGGTDYSHPVGSRRQIDLGIDINGGYGHSVDFHSAVGAPQRSLVRNLNLGGGINAGYKFKNGSNISLGGSAGWRHATSRRENFNNISAMSYSAHMNATVELPWDLQLRTNLSMTCNSGYDAKEMNEAQWLWNASLSKSLLKGRLVITASADDILGQVKPYSIHINAQGRSEVWTNTMRRYAFISVMWRFNKHPKKGIKN